MSDDERRERFEALARGLVEPLRRYLARRTDAATADDVLADVLLVCWRRLDDVPAGDEVDDGALPWAYAVARRCLANAERAARRQQRVAARLAVVDPPREAPDEAPDVPADAVADALAALPESDAEVLRLWAWEQLAPSEIAVVLGVSPNAASIRLHRARGKLADRLRKVGLGAGHEESRERRTT